MKTCSFCGKTKTNAKSRDAGGILHDVHKVCLKMFLAWLRVGGSMERPGDVKLAAAYNRLEN